MANPVKGEIDLELGDGRKFTLVLDMEALIAAEGVYGKPLRLVLMELMQGYIGATRALLYGALRAHHREVTVRGVAEMIGTDSEAINAAIECALEAMQQDKGASEDGDSANPPGKPSGGSGAKRGSTPKASGAKRRAPSR